MLTLTRLRCPEYPLCRRICASSAAWAGRCNRTFVVYNSRRRPATCPPHAVLPTVVGGAGRTAWDQSSTGATLVSSERLWYVAARAHGGVARAAPGCPTPGCPTSPVRRLRNDGSAHGHATGRPAGLRRLLPRLLAGFRPAVPARHHLRPLAPQRAADGHPPAQRAG